MTVWCRNPPADIFVWGGGFFVLGMIFQKESFWKFSAIGLLFVVSRIKCPKPQHDEVKGEFLFNETTGSAILITLRLGNDGSL